MRSVDQNEPVTRARMGSRWILSDRFGKRRIALTQMHRDDAVELLRIESLPQCGAQSVLAFEGGTKAEDAERRTAALSAADRDARHRADHVLETRHGLFRPIGRAGKLGAIGGAVEHVKRHGGVQAEIFRRALMRDIAPRLEKTLDGDALIEMFAVVPAIEFGLIGSIDVHRGQQHSLSGERHFRCPYPAIFDAMSATALITAFLMPES